MDLNYILIIICILFLLSLCLGMVKKGYDIQNTKQKSSSFKNTDYKKSDIDDKSDIGDNSNEGDNSESLLDQRFYDVSEVYPQLNDIYLNLPEIKLEISKIVSEDNVELWNDWPEKDIYATNREWKIIPFKAFDVIVNDNCKRFPHLWRFISNIPNIRVAIISKLGPGMKLKPHRGWGSHSNHVLRCHFGLNVPKENACFISVADKFDQENNIPIDEEIRYHSQDKWLVFDDSKHHYAENPTDADRIVLILDIDRPPKVKAGTSDEKDTKELLEIINSFKNK